MRDTDKLKEKVELSLDNRQVVSLIVGSLVMLGIVFVLGVLFGKQMGPAPLPASQPREALSSLDREADAGPVQLTFQQDLTRPAPPSTDLHGAAAARTAPPVRAEARSDPSAGAPTRAPPRTPTDPPTPAPASPSPAASPLADTSESHQPAAAQTPPPALDKKLAEAFSAARAAAPSAPEPAAAPPADGFTVQVAASQDKGEAAQALAKMSRSSLRPYLTEADIPGKGHWYRVRVGSFTSRAEADSYAKDLRRETGVAAFATPVH